MTTEQTGGGLVSAEVIAGGLPLAVFPYKDEDKTYVARDGRRLLDISFQERLYQKQKDWWEGRYGDKVPKRWLTPGWAIENYIQRTSRAKLQENGALLEAIAACPLTIHPFNYLAKKLPLSKELLALGFVNSLSGQPLIRASILERQRKMGVKPEILEEAQSLATSWESQLQRLT